MKRAFLALLCASALSLCASGAHAAAGNPGAAPVFQVSRAGDLDLSCHEISQEVSTMGGIIARTQEDMERSEATGTGIGIGKAVGSYLVGSMLGGIGIIAAGYIASEAADEQGEKASEIQDVAMQRRSFMEGIYNARGCAGPLEIALIEPASGVEDSAAQKIVPPSVPRYGYND